MKWPAIEEVCKYVELPEGYKIRVMSLSDLNHITKTLRKDFPDIETGSESVHLSESHYTDNCYLLETSDARNTLAIVFCKENEIAGMMTMRKDDLAKTLLGTMGCIFKEHRGVQLGVSGNKFFLECARIMGAGLAYTFVTTSHPYEQLAIEKAGFQLVGLVPAFDLDKVRGRSIKRVFEAVYAKVLCENSEIEFPNPNSLSPQCRALYQTLFQA